MTRIYYKKLSEIQPSQLYISAEKLARVREECGVVKPETLEPIPVKALDGEFIYTDGHTRALAALLGGLKEVRVYNDEDELDWEAYRICVGWCKAEGIFSIADLKDRVVPAETYEMVWHERCREMQGDLERSRRKNRG